MLPLCRRAVALLTAGLLLAACGADDDENGSPRDIALVGADSVAVVNYLPNLFAAYYGPGAASSLLFGGVRSHGTISFPAESAVRDGAPRLASLASGEFDAVGVQYLLDLTIDGEPVVGAGALVAGWRDVVAPGLLNEAFMAVAFEPGRTTFLDQASGTVPDDVTTFYQTLPGEGTLYDGISGAATLTSVRFGTAATDCSVTIPNFGTFACSYRYGRMEGTLGFTARESGGTAVSTFPETSFDVPAVRVTLSGTVNRSVRAEELRAALRRLIAQQQ